MILDVLRLEQEVKDLKGETPKNDKTGSKLGEAGQLGEIGKLKQQLAEKDRDLETMKKQSQGLSNEYNKLGDQMTQQDGTTKKER